MPATQSHGQLVEVTQLAAQEPGSSRNAAQTLDAPSPETQGRDGQVLTGFPSERVQQRTVKLIADMPARQHHDDTAEVTQLSPRARISERSAEQLPGVRVIKLLEKIVEIGEIIKVLQRERVVDRIAEQALGVLGSQIQEQIVGEETSDCVGQLPDVRVTDIPSERGTQRTGGKLVDAPAPQEHKVEVVKGAPKERLKLRPRTARQLAATPKAKAARDYISRMTDASEREAREEEYLNILQMYEDGRSWSFNFLLESLCL